MNKEIITIWSDLIHQLFFNKWLVILNGRKKRVLSNIPQWQKSISHSIRFAKFEIPKANKMRRFWRNVLIPVPNILQFCKIHLISFPRGHRAHVSSEIAFMQKTSYVGYRDSFTGWKSHPEMVYDVSEAWIFVKRKKKKKKLATRYCCPHLLACTKVWTSSDNDTVCDTKPVHTFVEPVRWSSRRSLSFLSFWIWDEVQKEEKNTEPWN